MAYATLRYNVFKGVPWSDWPVYVVNKVLALSSLLLLLLWAVRVRRRTGVSQADLLSVAGRFVLAHAGLSLAILSPGYFPSFFLATKLTWQAGLSVLVGVMAATGLRFSSRPDASRRRATTTLGVVAFMAGLHAALFGYASWSAPGSWPGFMVPITLIAFVSGVVALAAALPFRAGRGGGSRFPWPH